MGKTTARITAIVLAFVLFFFGGMLELLSKANPFDLSDELRQLQQVLGLRSSAGAGRGIVAAAQAEYESNHGIKSGEKYWRGYSEYNGTGYTSYGAWCVCFVYYCANLAGYLGPEGCMGSTWYTLCSDSWNYFKEQGCTYTSLDYVPEAGDLIYFGHDPGPTYQSFTHIAIVEYVEDGIVHTIEGNYSQTVSKRAVACQVGTPTDGVYIEGYAKPNYPAVQAGDVEQYVFDYLTGVLGLNTAAACGVLANIERESNFDLGAIGDVELGGSYGLCQWHAGRYANLVTFCNERNLDYRTLEGQLAYLTEELNTSKKSVLSKLQEIPNTSQGAYDAAYIWCVYFEVPADRHNEGIKRGNSAASTYWPQYGS